MTSMFSSHALEKASNCKKSSNDSNYNIYIIREKKPSEFGKGLNMYKFGCNWL